MAIDPGDVGIIGWTHRGENQRRHKMTGKIDDDLNLTLKYCLEQLTHLQKQVDIIQARFDRDIDGLDERLNDRLEKSEISIADKAVSLAVHRAFSYLGVDIDNPTDLQRFRDDLRFGGVFRNAASNGFLALIAAICGGIGLSLWIVIKEKIGAP